MTTQKGGRFLSDTIVKALGHRSMTEGKGGSENVYICMMLFWEKALRVTAENLFFFSS